MLIKLKSLSHEFTNEQKILDNITAESKGNSLAIIGPSGGGKSTLLRILGGLIEPSSGEIYLNDELLNFRTNPELRKKISFVFQSNGLFPHLTALQNIILPMVEVFSISKDEATKKALNLLHRFGLDKECDKFPYQLSGGQCQRISIVRAVAVKPELLLLDEPTSALDPEFTSEVLDMVNELSKEGLKIILVTHEMGFARLACDEVMFLSGGKIIEHQKSSEFFTQAKSPVVRDFLNKILEWS